MAKYSYSTDEETYHDQFDTIEQACNEAAAHVGVGGTFWVGECVEPPTPESRWRASDWLEDVSCQDEYSGDWADDWDQSTRAQREELEREVREVMAKWMDRHGLRPTFWNIAKPQRFHVSAVHGSVYEIEAL